MKKRVLMIVFSSYPEDIRVRKEAEALVEAGYTPDVICLRNKHKEKRTNVMGVEVYRINLESKKKGKIRYLWEYLYFMTTVSLMTAFQHFKEPYDVIHVHNVPNILVLCALIPRIFKTKMVLDMHENVPELFIQRFNMKGSGWGVRFLIFLEKVSVALVDHVIVATPFLKKLIQDRSLHEKGCTVLLNLSDPKFFKNIIKTENKSKKIFRLIYPGTLSHHHGIDIAIQAMHMIKKQTNINIELHIYGTGAEQDNLKAMASELNLDKVVIFHDRVSFEELVSIMSTMDAGVVPKRDGVFVGEAISTKLFDFAAIGLPAVVSYTAGDALYFDNSMVSFFEAENIEQMVESILKLYFDPVYRKTLSTNMWTLSQRLNWDTAKHDLYKIYDELTIK